MGFTFGQSAKRNLMTWVTSRVPESYLQTPFPQCLQDGILLCALVESLVPGACPRFDLLDPEQKLRNLKLALHLVIKYLHIKPEISAEDILSTGKSIEKDLFVLLSQIKMASEKQNLFQSLYVAKLLEHDSSKAFDYHQHCQAKGMGLMLAVQGRKSCFSIMLESSEFLDIVIEIRGPENTFCTKRIASASLLSKSNVITLGEVKVVDDSPKMEIPLAYHILGRKICVGYTPLENGKHSVSIIWQGQHIKDSPYVITVDKSVDILDPEICSTKPPMINFLKTSNKLGNTLLENSGNSGIPSDAVKQKGKVIRKKILRYIVKIGGNDVVIDDPDKLCEIINSLKTQSVDQNSKCGIWNAAESNGRLPESNIDPKDESIAVSNVDPHKCVQYNTLIPDKAFSPLQELEPKSIRDKDCSLNIFDQSEANKIVSKENIHIPSQKQNKFLREITENRIGYQNFDVENLSDEKQNMEDRNEDISLVLQSTVQKDAENTVRISIDENDSKGKDHQVEDDQNVKLNRKDRTDSIHNPYSVRKFEAISKEYCKELIHGFNENLENNEVLPYIKQIIDTAKIRSEKRFYNSYENYEIKSRNPNINDEKHSNILHVCDVESYSPNKTNECDCDANESPQEDIPNNFNSESCSWKSNETDNVTDSHGKNSNSCKISMNCTSETLDINNSYPECPGKKIIDNDENNSTDFLSALCHKSDLKGNFKNKSDAIECHKNAVVPQSNDSLDLHEKLYSRTKSYTTSKLDVNSRDQKQTLPNANIDLFESTSSIDVLNDPQDKHSSVPTTEYDDNGRGIFRTNISLFRCDHSFPCYNEGEPDLYTSGVDSQFQSSKIQNYPVDDSVISLLQKTKDSLDSLLTTSDNIILQNMKSNESSSGALLESHRAACPNSQCDLENDDSRSQSPEVEEMTFEVHRNVDDRNDLEGQGRRISWSDKCWLPCIRESSIESLADFDDVVLVSNSEKSSTKGLEPSHDIRKHQLLCNSKVPNVENVTNEQQCSSNMVNANQLEYPPKNMADSDTVKMKVDNESLQPFRGISEQNKEYSNSKKNILKPQLLYNSKVVNLDNVMNKQQCSSNMTNQFEFSPKKMADPGTVKIKVYSECLKPFHGICDQNIITTNTKNSENRMVKTHCDVPVTKTNKDGDVLFSINSSKELALQSQYEECNRYSKFENGILNGDSNTQSIKDRDYHFSMNSAANCMDKAEKGVYKKCKTFKSGTCSEAGYYNTTISNFSLGILANSNKHLENESLGNSKMADYDCIEFPINEQRVVQCPSVKKVIKIFQQETEEPIDKWPEMENNTLISPCRSRKAFIENLLDCPGKSQLQSDGVLDSFKVFKNEKQSKAASIRDRVKIFENENTSCNSDQNIKYIATESSNNPKESLSTVLHKKRYWENKLH